MPLMTRAEFARHMDVNRSTVTRWIERGRLEVGAGGLIDLEAARRTLAATESPEPHHQARTLQIADEKAKQAEAGTDQAAQGNTPAADNEDAGRRLRLAMAKEKEAKAELAAMDRDKQASLLVERSQVDFVMRDIGNTLRSAVESLSDRHAATIAAFGGDVNRVHAALDDAGRDLLNEIVAHMQRRAEELAA